MAVLYANNASSKLAASITNTATSFSVTAGQGALFPAISGADYFYVTLMDSAGNMEIVKVTARVTDTFTVVRGQEGTTARAYSVNDFVELRITKAMLDDLKSDARIGQLYGAASGAPDSWIWSVSPANPTWGIYYNEGTPDAIEFKAAGTTTASVFLDTGAANFAGALTQNNNQVLHAGNYNSYAPTLTGTGASGTWGISISGNAASASSVAWTNVSGRPTAVSSFSNDSGYITGSYLSDYTNGAYRVIADYASSNTWYIRSNGRFTWARGHDWTQAFELNLESGTAASNNGWAEFGQRQSNNAAGTWYGTRFVQYTGSTKTDGHIRAANHYLGADNSYITNAGDSSARVQTAYGYIDIGPKNSSWCHIYSDKAFYFNQELYVNNVQVVKNSGTWDISISGSAATLTTARTINGTSFNGSANITTANWGTARTINGVSINGSTNYTIPGNISTSTANGSYPLVFAGGTGGNYSLYSENAGGDNSLFVNPSESVIVSERAIAGDAYGLKVRNRSAYGAGISFTSNSAGATPVNSYIIADSSNFNFRSDGGTQKFGRSTGNSSLWLRDYNADAVFTVSNDASVIDLRAVNQANNAWRWMRIQEGGDLVVGSGNPNAAKLTCSGRIYGLTGRDEAGYYVGCPDQSLGRVIRFPTGGYLEWTSNVGAIGTSYFNSDERLKKNIAPTAKTARQAIDQIEFKQFDWNEFTDQNNEHVDLGVVAQQLQQVNPKFVNEMSDSTLGVNEPELLTYALKAIQELSAELSAVRQELIQLQGAA